MTAILKAAVSGLLAQRSNLDTIANNIANISTTGFKKSRAIFTDAPYETAVTFASERGLAESEVKIGTGVSLAGVQRVFSPGSFTETGNAWDLAIAGEGFFQVALPDGRRAYTRDGSFEVDGQGRLATLEGLLVDPSITVPPDVEYLDIDQGGVIRAEVEGQRVELGAIAIARFPNPEGLLALGHNLFAPSESSGEAQAGEAGADGRGQIISGLRENSNVDLAEEMTRAIEAQRAYQLSIKILQTADEMLGLANNLRR